MEVMLKRDDRGSRGWAHHSVSPSMYINTAAFRHLRGYWYYRMNVALICKL